MRKRFEHIVDRSERLLVEGAHPIQVGSEVRAQRVHIDIENFPVHGSPNLLRLTDAATGERAVVHEVRELWTASLRSVHRVIAHRKVPTAH